MSTAPPKPSTPKERAEALAEARITASAVIDRLEIELKIETDGELASLAGVSKATVSTWRSRNSIPFELIVYLSLSGIVDLDYVLTGRGRLSGFLEPSESINDPELQREIFAAALAAALPIKATLDDVQRASEFIVERKKFLENFVVRTHKSDRSGLFSGKYIKHIREVIHDLTEKRLPPPKKPRQKAVK
jgi:hypothetical protein